MNKLLIIKYLKAEDEESPEFSYFLSYCVKEARTVIDTDLLIWHEGDPSPEIPVSDLVLVVGKENVSFTSESIKRMIQLVNDSNGIVIPQKLSAYKISHSANIYTIRGYEEVEFRIFNEFHEPLHLNKNHLPISLFSRSIFLDLLEKSSFYEIMNDANLIDIVNLNTKVSYKGVFHQFIDYYAELRDDVLPFIPEKVQDVLEIGCGRGVTGKYIQEKRNCRVTGVELNSQVINDARQNLYNIIQGDVLQVKIPGTYDVVLATELFEHLNYPENFLTKMYKILNPGGRIILSTPNVGHYSIVDDLLHGRWDYVPIGLLCYTHFRFFTYKTLDDWMKRLGFESYEIIRQLTELPQKYRKINGADIENLSTKGFYVIIDKPSE